MKPEFEGVAFQGISRRAFLISSGLTLVIAVVWLLGTRQFVVLETSQGTRLRTSPRLADVVRMLGNRSIVCITFSYAALIGFTLADPNAAWPNSYTGITMTVDAEGDGSAGLTALPRVGGGFVAPPTSIAQSARVDKVYIVSRNTVSAMATRNACDTTTATLNFTHFDNHVVGCHVMGGSDCMPSDTNFVDQNRTIYQVGTAMATSKIVADTATCADVRAALPM